MSLIIQIQSIAFSFIFGIFYSLLFNFFYNFLFTKRIVDVLYNGIFVLCIYSLYFYILSKINNGIIHYYFVISLWVGFFTYCQLFVKLRVNNKKTNVNN